MKKAQQGVEQQPAISLSNAFSFALLSRRCAHFDVLQDMKTLLLSLCILASFTGCSETKKAPLHKYARLTVIYGEEDSFGERYFWETPTEKTDAMNREAVHKYFRVELPVENELKVTPFDYKVIDYLVQSGWSLVAVSSTGRYKEDAGSYKDAIIISPMTTYHFSQ